MYKLTGVKEGHTRISHVYKRWEDSMAEQRISLWSLNKSVMKEMQLSAHNRDATMFMLTYYDTWASYTCLESFHILQRKQIVLNSRAEHEYLKADGCVVTPLFYPSMCLWKRWKLTPKRQSVAKQGQIVAGLK